MQYGRVVTSAVCFWLVISGALANSLGNMKGPAVKPVRQSRSLCAGEQDYVDKRKHVVLESLNNLGINCTSTDSVPHIALLGSGGGQRAAVSLLGSLYQMRQDALLDTLLYLGGVSGSTWSMSSLYSDPEWSADGHIDRAVSRLTGPGVELEEALAWLDERSQEELFSFSDVWGVMTSAGFMKQMDLRHLSGEASRNATNPYPIYGAIEKRCFFNGSIEGKWFEVSPHEAGFTDLGVFIETSLLGSKINRGELLEKKPEMDMVKLQGVLGCALADEETMKEYLPPWLNVPADIDGGAEELLRVFIAFNKLITLTRCTIEDPAALSDLDKLQKILKDIVNGNNSVFLELLQAVETWSQRLEDGPFKTHISLFTKHIIPMISKWEWGTTRNFLYQYEDFTVPACLYSEEIFYLIDGGLMINVNYPSFLGDKRDVDLIIAPEYSAGNMFETLTLARDYAAKLKKPFPEIDDRILEDRDWPNDCYVFEGKGTELSIIYMPLFNRQNCKDAAEVKARMEEFSTFQRPFNLQKIQFLMETAKTNMKNNKETLLREINKAALRRQRKRDASAAADPV